MLAHLCHPTLLLSYSSQEDAQKASPWHTCVLCSSSLRPWGGWWRVNTMPSPYSTFWNIFFFDKLARGMWRNITRCREAPVSTPILMKSDRLASFTLTHLTLESFFQTHDGASTFRATTRDLTWSPKSMSLTFLTLLKLLTHSCHNLALPCTSSLVC